VLSPPDRERWEFKGFARSDRERLPAPQDLIAACIARRDALNDLIAALVRAHKLGALDPAQPSAPPASAPAVREDVAEPIVATRVENSSSSES
jgi:hypothetical protein